MTTFKIFSAAGVAAIQAAVVDTSGYPRGITGSLTNGSGAPFKLTKMARKVGGKVPNPTKVTQSGDNNRSKHIYLFQPEELSDLTLMFGAYDLDVHIASNATLIATSGNSNMVLLQPNTPPMSSQLCVLCTYDAQAADSGQNGRKRFITDVYPLVFLTSLDAEHDTVAKADWEYFGVPTQSDKLPWGESLTVSTHGATLAAGVRLTSDYPITMETFIGNTSSTQYTLTYTPAGTAASGYVQVWKNGTALSTSAFTVSTTSKILTFTTAPATGDVCVIRYEAVDLLQG